MSRQDFIPAARFRFLTPFYDRACSLIGLGTALRRFELGLLGPLPPGEALEVGCGTGELLLRMAERYPHTSFTGLDPDAEALAVSARKFSHAGLRVELKLGRAETLPFADGRFQLVVSSLMLHHLDRATKLLALREWRRVLAPGGRLLLVDFGVPRSRLARLILWPLRFDLFEEQSDNFRGRVPGLLQAAGFDFEEVGVYRSAVVAYDARPGPGTPGTSSP